MSRATPRLLLLCERLDVAGGVERFVCTLANHLAAQGLVVSVGSVDTPPARVRYALDPAVRVLSGSAPQAAGRSGPRAWQLLRAQWRTGRALGRLIRAQQPDVVLLNGLTTACSVLALHPGCAARAVCCDHNHFNARSRPWRWLRARLYPRVAAVVSLTEADAPKFRVLNPRTEVIYNASSLRADEPASPEGDLVLAVGRHVAQKGFDLLLDAWQRVAQALPLARLRVIGEGPLQPEAMQRARALGIAASVQWLGPTDAIERHYREAALFVLSSRYEGMPLSLLEAQALGVPAVAFDCPTGPREIISPETGIVVPAFDTDALAQAIVTLLRQPALRERMAQAALRRSAELFSPQQHLQRWTALLCGVAGMR